MQFSPPSSSSRAVERLDMWRIFRCLLGIPDRPAIEEAWVAIVTAQQEQAERRREYERRQREIDRALAELASRARTLRHYAERRDEEP